MPRAKAKIPTVNSPKRTKIKSKSPHSIKEESKTAKPPGKGKKEPVGKNKAGASKITGTITSKDIPSGEIASIGLPDLKKFEFAKKPHIKIEFEKDVGEEVNKEPKGLWEPANWKDFLLNLRNMRANNDAPVDSMGCHMSMDENAPPEVIRYQSLISLMLSSQTKDQVTFAAMERLRAKGLTIDNVLDMSDEELGQLIYPVGFWKTKVKYIKKTTLTLKEQYNGDIPDSAEKLCKLTGVGPKMAHICMKVAWNKVTGIGVDTHVHRISNRIGWVKKPTATPEETRKSLQSWLPYDLWSEVNHLMVGFGQTICLPIGPICHECLNRDICPSSGLGRKSPNKKSPVKKNVKEELEDDFTVKKEFLEPTKSSRNKIAVKNDLQTQDNNTPDDIDEFDVKGKKFAVPTTTKIKSPRKKKGTPNNEIKDEFADLDQLDAKGDTISETLKRKSPLTKQNKTDVQDKNLKETAENDTTKKKKIKAAKK